MDGLTFISEMTKALEWPAAVVAIVMFLRRPLGKLIPLLRKLKYGDFEAQFDTKLNEAQQVAEEVRKTEPLTATKFEPEAVERVEGLTALAETDPVAAIRAAWSELQKSVRNAAERISLSIPLKASTRAIVAKFRYDGLLRPELWRLFGALLELHNLVIYSPDRPVTPDEARQFISMVAILVSHFESVEPSGPAQPAGNPTLKEN